ncbi:hypothetical protein Golomagni_05927 [Golovinomyces magnicellulatus]|nr:hypothetical protein Golomagni_05927 [Golovinomyces magnicellulatus]
MRLRWLNPGGLLSAHGSEGNWPPGLSGAATPGQQQLLEASSNRVFLHCDIQLPKIQHIVTMSRASKLTLLGTSMFAVGTVTFVHYQQKAEQAGQAMHEGVVRDMEQQRIKRERQLDFDMQKALEEEYKRHQNVHSSLDSIDKDKPSGQKG